MIRSLPSSARISQVNVRTSRSQPLGRKVCAIEWTSPDVNALENSESHVCAISLTSASLYIMADESNQEEESCQRRRSRERSMMLVAAHGYLYSCL